MKKYVLFLTTILTAISLHAQVQTTRMTMLMGAKFELGAVAADSLQADMAIDDMIAEIKRIEYLISDWIDTTQVSAINKYAGIAPVKVDKELIDLTLRAIHISDITQGAFDISFAAMEKVWKFDGTMTTLPDSAVIHKAKAKVGYKNILVDTVMNTIYLKLPGMKIGFGALGEGYAADRCETLMKSKGINAGFVNGSGDIKFWGKQADNNPWLVGVMNPTIEEDYIAAIPVHNSAVTTSGSYQKYAEINGKRYAHIINPATGYPSEGLISVTVFGPKAEFANALSTSLMVKGKEAGLLLIKQFPDYNCIMIEEDGAVTKHPNKPLEEWSFMGE